MSIKSLIITLTALLIYLVGTTTGIISMNVRLTDLKEHVNNLESRVQYREYNNRLEIEMPKDHTLSHGEYSDCLIALVPGIKYFISWEQADGVVGTELQDSLRNVFRPKIKRDAE